MKTQSIKLLNEQKYVYILCDSSPLVVSQQGTSSQTSEIATTTTATETHTHTLSLIFKYAKIKSRKKKQKTKNEDYYNLEWN